MKKRLTKKYGKYGRPYCFNCKEPVRYDNDIVRQMLYKMGELEDLQEQIGCSIVDAIKASYILITKGLNMEEFVDCMDAYSNDSKSLEAFNKKQWTSSEINMGEYKILKNVYLKIITKYYKEHNYESNKSTKN